MRATIVVLGLLVLVAVVVAEEGKKNMMKKTLAKAARLHAKQELGKKGKDFFPEEKKSKKAYQNGQKRLAVQLEEKNKRGVGELKALMKRLHDKKSAQAEKDTREIAKKLMIKAVSMYAKKLLAKKGNEATGEEKKNAFQKGVEKIKKAVTEKRNYGAIPNIDVANLNFEVTSSYSDWDGISGLSLSQMYSNIHNRPSRPSKRERTGNSDWENWESSEDMSSSIGDSDWENWESSEDMSSSIGDSDWENWESSEDMFSSIGNSDWENWESSEDISSLIGDSDWENWESSEDMSSLIGNSDWENQKR